MTTRAITGPLRKPDGSVWANATVTFKLQTNFATATDATIPHSTVTVTTDVNGDFTATLEVPATNAWRWHCILPDNSLFAFNLGAGASTTLHALLADANLGATVSASAIATAISDKADKAMPAATNNIALLGADGNLVDSGLGTDDLGGASDHGALTGLADDDHTQYLRADGTRALAGAWDMGSQVLTNVNIDSGTVGAAAIGDLYSAGGTDVAVADGGTGASTAAAARANLDALPIDAGIVSVSSSRDLLATDNGKILEATGTITITAPDGLDTGFQVAIVNVGSGTITIAADTTLQSKDSAVTIATQYAAATLYHRGSNVWLLLGDIA